MKFFFIVILLFTNLIVLAQKRLENVVLKKTNLHILSIGTAPPDLEYTDDDARDFAKKFQCQAREGGLFDNIFIDTLIGEQATGDNIKIAFEQLQIKNLKPSDVLIIFAASHGDLDSAGNLYLKANDYGSNKEKGIVSYEEIINKLNQVNCKKILLIDACHSGAGRRIDPERLAEENKIINKAIEKIQSTTSGLTFIASSSGTQSSYEHSKWQNGAFTECLLKGLDGAADANRDSIINLYELNHYVYTEVPKLVLNTYWEEQEPIFVKNDLKKLPIFSLNAYEYQIITIPAEYETITEQVLYREAYKKFISIPAEYETQTETIEVSPESKKWIKRKDKNCSSANPDDCLFWCLVDVAARYETVTKTVVKRKASVTEVDVPAEYQTITKKIIKTPAKTIRKKIPCQY